MARNYNDFEEVEKESAGGFERFLVLMIPIIFTIVLLGVLLILFNMNIRNAALEIANKIPVVQNWVPAPNLDPEKTKLQENKEEIKSAESTIKELKDKLSAQQTELKQATEGKTQQDTQLKDLQSQIETLQNESILAENPEQKVDNYQKQIDELAKMYGNLSPSKAAPIIQNLTLEEMVLMFESMKSDKRIAIFEKMDPKVAAEVTMMMKDAKPAQDLQISALQSRVKKNDTATTQTSDKLNKSQLSQTFATMTPQSAADLLFQTYKISPEKTLTILNSVDDKTRSSILGKMSSIDSVTTAKILNKLMSK
ncbi:MotE family protein [Paenibacillus macquariensis]|uniref:Flagellar motility protein MotE, a chaperone for MotC folding n=1 Tax=Paenibacillus macquariensis TaxID=948756 RepID=A0ABY1K052_9BACL|nr:kinesin [Paenibacillus macquariensis]MEC0091405.1 kinesin [Paenibacillus macquariensis]SIR06043.1 Flagellar motility protein MotE, a chaperone for MotC folding [Paenibacillus macquariensis]